MERGEELKGSEFITPEEIQLISGQDFEGAVKDHKEVRHSLGFDSDELMVEQYCNYHDLDLEEVIQFLNAERSFEELILEEEEEELELDEISISDLKELDQAYAEFLEEERKIVQFDEEIHSPINEE